MQRDVQLNSANGTSAQVIEAHGATTLGGHVGAEPDGEPTMHDQINRRRVLKNISTFLR
jgi:hypothetical protein